jgi:serine/threonine protein kinase
MNLQPGVRISGSVELRSFIGHGGMGQVWAGIQGPLRRGVAVKFLRESMAQDEGALQRFVLEAQTLARLPCKHVPQIFDFGTLPDGTPFIVMELLEGVDLEKRLELGGPLSLAQAAKLIAQMASVLAVAHNLGFVHRDIKPGNIVLLENDREELTAKLLDFGLAKTPVFADSAGLTQTGTTLGTPSYMSPEQLLSARAVGAGADLWSLAVVAYRALTGELPFSGETFAAVYLSIERSGFASPSILRPELPAAIDGWFQKALSPNSEIRFASATEMADAFKVAIAQSTERPPAVLADPSLSSAQSHPRLNSKSQKRRGGSTVRAVGVASLVVFCGLALAPRGSFGPDWAALDWLSMQHQALGLLDACTQWATSLVR